MSEQALKKEERTSHLYIAENNEFLQPATSGSHCFAVIFLMRHFLFKGFLNKLI
jgi:hypothetical protein